MKKALFFIFAAITVFVACNKEVNADTPEVDQKENLVTYSFVVSQESTPKATIDDAGTFAWQSTDKIAIYNTVDSKFYLFAAESEGTTVNFSRVAAAGADFTVAYYPASLVMSASEITAGVSSSAVVSTSSVSLPASYATVAEAASGFPMSGSVDSEGELEMSHLGGMFRFSFKNVPYQACKLVVSAGSGISGNYTVSDGKITATGSGTVTINFVKGASSVFSVPVPTGSYSTLTVTLKDQSNNTLFAKTKSTSTSVGRKKLLNVAAVDAMGEEFYLLCNWDNGWSLSGRKIQFIKTGATTYRVAENVDKNNHGFKVCPGYYWGSPDYSGVYGAATINSYTGTLGVGEGSNCNSGYDSNHRIQYFTIDMSNLSWTTTDPNSGTEQTSASGASNLYLLGDVVPGGWSFSGGTTLAFEKMADQNWKLQNVTITSGAKYFKLFETWNNWGSFWGDGSISSTPPYGQLTFHADSSDSGAATHNLEAGVYTILFNSYLGDIWFIRTGDIAPSGQNLNSPSSLTDDFSTYFE